MSYTKLTYHLVTSTKYRHRTIRPDIERLLYTILFQICRDRNAYVHRIGGDEDHVRLLVDIPSTIAVSDFVKHLKMESSRFIREKTANWEGWEEGFGCLTVSASTIPTVTEYIKNQKQHHRRETFIDEYRKMLIGMGISPESPYFPK